MKFDSNRKVCQVVFFDPQFSVEIHYVKDKFRWTF